MVSQPAAVLRLLVAALLAAMVVRGEEDGLGEFKPWVCDVALNGVVKNSGK